MVERPRPGGRRRPREVERSHPARADLGADQLDHGMGRHLVLDRRSRRRASRCRRGVGERRHARRDARADRSSGSRPAGDDDVVPAFGIMAFAARGPGRSRRDGRRASSPHGRRPSRRRRRSRRCRWRRSPGPTPDSTARSQTCTIIGLPLMSASGLFGRRVAAIRAGMTTRGSDMARMALPGVKK